jgi:hypothetical protein
VIHGGDTFGPQNGFALEAPQDRRLLVPAPRSRRPTFRRGKTIVQKTLDTKDPAEAKRRFLPVAAAFDREWARPAAAEEITPPRERDRLKPKQVLGIAGEFYRWMVSKHDGDPGKAEKWRKEVETDRRFIVPPQTKLNGLNWVTGGPHVHKQSRLTGDLDGRIPVALVDSGAILVPSGDAPDLRPALIGGEFLEDHPLGGPDQAQDISQEVDIVGPRLVVADLFVGPRRMPRRSRPRPSSEAATVR